MTDTYINELVEFYSLENGIMSDNIYLWNVNL